MIREAVPMIIAVTLTHEIILMAFVDFLALKYRQAKRNFNIDYLFIALIVAGWFLAFNFFEKRFHFIDIVQ